MEGAGWDAGALLRPAHEGAGHLPILAQLLLGPPQGAPPLLFQLRRGVRAERPCEEQIDSASDEEPPPHPHPPPEPDRQGGGEHDEGGEGEGERQRTHPEVDRDPPALLLRFRLGQEDVIAGEGAGGSGQPTDILEE